MSQNYCRARINTNGDYVRVGHMWVHVRTLKKVAYRWANEETDREEFQLFYAGAWREAQSIDFEFINSELSHVNNQY